MPEISKAKVVILATHGFEQDELKRGSQLAEPSR